MDDASLQQIFALLKAKDDTSRFVALSLLRSWLDTQNITRQPSALSRSWNAIPKAFLLRLLKTRPSEKINEDDARNMNHLAVAVISTFTNLLPVDEVDSEAFVALCEPLINAIPNVEAPQKMLILQSLQCIASTRSGRNAFLYSTNLFEALCQKVTEDQLLVQVMSLVRVLGVSEDLSKPQEQVFRKLVVSLLETYKSRLDLVFKVLAEILNSKESIEKEDFDAWISPALLAMKLQIVRQPKRDLRESSVLLAGSLLRNTPSSMDFPTLLFTSPSTVDAETLKNFSYLFVMLLLVDIRSTIPVLMSTLADSSYPSVSFRLALSYDLLSAFLSVLLRHSEEDGDEFDIFGGIQITPDQLLKLRKDLTETFSLTFEYFRDRWDAAIAGAPGLHQTARAPDPSTTSAPLPLTWDNPILPPAKDPIIISGLRAASLWLREDDNESLRSQALGILDMLLDLYKSISENPEDAGFRQPILTALHGVLPSSNTAVQDFLDQNGWRILTDDFMEHFKNNSLISQLQDIIRVLLDVVESSNVYQSKEAWMNIIAVAAEKELPRMDHGLDLTIQSSLEDIIATYQLALTIYDKAPTRLQKLFFSQMKKMKQNAAFILKLVDSSSNADLVQDAQDIVKGLSNLSLG
jgi:Neurochondrin